MNELMRANLFRIKRDKVFWACFAVVLGVSAAFVFMGVRQCHAMAAEGYTAALEGSLFQLAPAIGMCAAVFTGLYLGTDQSEGAIRNRLIVGHSRGAVYLAGLGIAVTAALAFTGAWLAGGGAAALLGREFWQMGAGQSVLYFLVAAASAVALASVLTVVGMLSEKKSTAAVASILLALGMVLLSTWLYSRLLEPEMESGLIITAAGMEWGDPTPNPLYVGGVLRQVFEGLLNILPTGQAVLLSDLAVAHPVGDLLASAAVTLVATLAGMALFRKKDLK